MFNFWMTVFPYKMLLNSLSFLNNISFYLGFFHVQSRFTEQQKKQESISLTIFYNFHLLHIYLEISRVITSESLPLHIASTQTRTLILWFLNSSC